MQNQRRARAVSEREASQRSRSLRLQICRNVIALRSACCANVVVSVSTRAPIFVIEARMISWLCGDLQKEIRAQESHALSALQQIDLQVRCSAVVFVFDGR